MDRKGGIREILGQLSPSPRSYYAFESILLRLLEVHLNTINKSLKTGPVTRGRISRIMHQVDAIAPEGVDKLPGPTLIEIKFSPQLPLRVELMNRINILATQAECNSVLFVLGRTLRDEHRQSMMEYWRVNYPRVPVDIWDIEKLDELFSNHRNELEPIMANLAEFRLRSVVEKPILDWKEEREARLDDLAVSFNDGNLSLVLGAAGVSIDSGLPDWTRLLDSLFVRLLTKDLAINSGIRDEEIDAIVKRLKDVDDPSPLMTARYLRRGLDDSASGEAAETFYTSVGAELYKPSKSKTRKDTWIRALAKMTHPRRTGAKIKAVVTYNFDDLLEKELTSTGDSFRSVFREGDIPTSDELPIYHVHGFIPEDPEPYDHLDESHLVFSEEGYHVIYVDSYHWSNLVQLNLFRESTCLFVGLSLTDPNLRRLLEISARRVSDQKHFAFMQRMSVNSFVSDKGKNVVRARKQSVQQFLENHHRIKEELFRELGVSIIWFEDYKDVPRLLKRVQK